MKCSALGGCAAVALLPYISFPGNAPRHGMRCGSKEPCLFYLRYSRPFDIKY